MLDTEPLFPAGEGYHYTDTGYILVGLIIERAAGNAYYEELQRCFLDPLGLNLTGPADRRGLPHLAAGYIQAEPPLGLPPKVTEDGRLVFNPATEWTGGGLVTNPQDLACWAKVLYEGKVLEGTYLDELRAGVSKDALQRTRFGPNGRYGLGVTIRQTALGNAYGHRGWTPGYLSIFAYYPGHRLVVALQVNESESHDMTAALEALARTAAIGLKP